MINYVKTNKKIVTNFVFYMTMNDSFFCKKKHETLSRLRVMCILCVNAQKMVWKDAHHNQESVSLGVGGFEQRLKHFTLFHNY